MSADNYVALRKINDVWHVWMVLGGYDEEDWTKPDGYCHKQFENELDAHHYAHWICEDTYVEYGVTCLGSIED